MKLKLLIRHTGHKSFSSGVSKLLFDQYPIETHFFFKPSQQEELIINK